MKRLDFTKISIWITMSAAFGLGIVIIIVAVLTGSNNYFKQVAKPSEEETVISSEINQELETFDAVIVATTISVVAENQTEYGIDPGSDFIITLDEEGVTSDQLRSRISVEPYTSFEIIDEETHYRLRFATPLSENQLVKIKYIHMEETQGWAFQTLGDFCLSSMHYIEEQKQLVLSFNKQAPEKLSDYFYTIPATKGSFTYDHQQVIYTPEYGFDPSITYDVVIEAGYGYENDDLSIDTYGYIEATKNKHSFSWIDFDEPYALLEKKDRTLWRFNLNDLSLLNEEAILNIFKVTETKNFLEAIEKAPFLEEDQQLRSLIKYEGHWTIPVTIDYDSQTGNGYVELMENLEQGLYVMELTLGDHVYDQLVQLSYYNGYANYQEEELLVFIANTHTGEVASNMYLYVNDNPYGVTDDYGVCFADVSREDHIDTVIMANNEGEQFLLVHMDNGENRSALYTDIKASYQSETMGYITGMVLEPDLESLEMVVSSNNKALHQETIAISESNSFGVSIDWSIVDCDQVKINFYGNGKKISSHDVLIDKEDQVLKLETSKRVLTPGKVIELYAYLAYSYGDTLKDQEVVFTYKGQKMTALTNDYGIATVALVPNIHEVDDEPGYLNFQVSYNDNQGHYYEDEAFVTYYPRDMSISGEIAFSDQYLDGYVYDIDTSNENPYSDKLQPGRQVPVRLEVYRQASVERLLGYVEDIFNNRDLPLYQYETSWHLIDLKKTSTDKSGYFSTEILTMDEEETYRFDLSVYDKGGKEVILSWYEYGRNGDYRGLMGDETAYEIVLDKKAYEIGDKLSASVSYMDLAIKDTSDNSALYMYDYNGLYTFEYAKDIRTEIIIDEAPFNEATISAIYFNGYEMVHLEDQPIVIDRSHMALDVDIEIDEGGQPGDISVTTNISVEDYKGDSTIADIYIKVIDLSDVNTCKEVDQHSVYETDMMEEVTGYPLIQTFSATSNGLGQYNLVFDLPEDVVRYGVEVIAYGEDYYAGSEIAFGSVSELYDISPILQDVYDLDEPVIISLKVNGMTTQKVLSSLITIKDSDNQVVYEEAYESTIGYNPSFFVGALGSGQYDMTIETVIGGKSYLNESGFKVKEPTNSDLTISTQLIEDQMLVEFQENIPVFIYLSNQEISGDIAKLETFRTNNIEDILINKIVCDKAVNILSGTYNIPYIHEDIDYDLLFSNNDEVYLDQVYHIAFGLEDPGELLANQMDRIKTLVANYQINEDKVHYYQGLAVLAICQEPVLMELRNGPESNMRLGSGLTAERLYLLQGLIASGDFNKAKEMYKNIRTYYTYESVDSIRLKGSLSKYHVIMLWVSKALNTSYDKWFNGLVVDDSQGFYELIVMDHLAKVESFSNDLQFAIVDSAGSEVISTKGVYVFSKEDLVGVEHLEIRQEPIVVTKVFEALKNTVNDTGIDE